MKYGLMYFRLIGGGHTEGNKFDDTAVEYKKGDIIESTRDLQKIFGSKFERILDEDDLPEGNSHSIEEEFLLAIKEPLMPKNIEVDCKGKYRLSILICSIIGREQSLNKLLEDLEKQKTDKVEILVKIDNKKLSIGAKRNLLLKKAKGDYIVFIDDDDEASVNYITKILYALKTNPDCCGIEGLLIRPGHKFKFLHSIQYRKWYNKDDVYYRNPNHLNPVRRELALQVGFPKINHGEDQDYSSRLFPLLKTEEYIHGVLYYYVKMKGVWRK